MLRREEVEEESIWPAIVEHAGWLTRPDGELHRCGVWVTCRQPATSEWTDPDCGHKEYFCAEHGGDDASA